VFLRHKKAINSYCSGSPESTICAVFRNCSSLDNRSGDAFDYSGFFSVGFLDKVSKSFYLFILISLFAWKGEIVDNLLFLIGIWFWKSAVVLRFFGDNGSKSSVTTGTLRTWIKRSVWFLLRS